MYEKYHDQGLEIFAFPCNNFGGQEPKNNDEIFGFAQSKGARFPVFGKLDCVGSERSHPLYQYLSRKIGGGIIGLGDNLKWNFHKFLTDKNGIPVKRYGPTDNPLSFEQDVVSLLQNGGLAPSSDQADL